MTFENGDKGVTRLRLFNPNDSDSVAIVGGSRITVPAGQIVEPEGLTGTVAVRDRRARRDHAHQRRVRGGRAEREPRPASRLDRTAPPEIASLAITTQTCSSTTLIQTASVACQQGTSAAMVEAISGATYEWSSAVNAQILNGLGTNMVTLVFGFAPTASVSVVVKTPDGCTLNGTATISVRTPFTFSTICQAGFVYAPQLHTRQENQTVSATQMPNWKAGNVRLTKPALLAFTVSHRTRGSINDKKTIVPTIDSLARETALLQCASSNPHGTLSHTPPSTGCSHGLPGLVQYGLARPT